MLDPFVTALATALEEVVRRGVEVTPTAGGWQVRLAAVETPEQASPTVEEPDVALTWARRSW